MRPLLLLLLVVVIPAPALAQQDMPLQSQLDALTSHYAGKVGLYAIDLRSGKTVGIAPDTPVQTASTIKLTILFEALKQIEAGTARPEDTLTMTKADQVQGSGVLQLFDTPMNLTLKDALTMMIDVSDNTGTNLVIDRLGLRNIDRRIRWMGLRETWLYKKVFLPPPPDAPADEKQFGLGKTTPREMAAVMQRFADCNLDAAGTVAAPTAQDLKMCAIALHMLKDQTDQNGIPRYLNGVVVANKTGALDDVRNDVGIVYAKNGPIVISAYTYGNRDQRWTADNAGELLIAAMARAVVDRWQ
jgi:beta-lactamase class A